MATEETSTGADNTPAGETTAAPGGEASTATAAQPATTLLTGDTATAETTEQPAGEVKTPEGEAKDDKTEKPAGAPESYAAFDVPEGVTLDEGLMTEFQSVAKELNLTQEQAQKLTSLGANLTQKNGAAVQESLQKAQAEWADAARADKEFGGEKLNENLGIANKALAAHGSPELIGLLKGSGLGNHPEFIRFMYRVGKDMKSDTFVPNGTASGGRKTDAEVFYGNKAQN